MLPDVIVEFAKKKKWGRGNHAAGNFVVTDTDEIQRCEDVEMLRCYNVQTVDSPASVPSHQPLLWKPVRLPIGKRDCSRSDIL